MALGKSVREAQASISSREFVYWMAYFRMEPWGEDRADLRMAQGWSLIANINRKKDAEPFTVADFMLFMDHDRREAARAAAKEKRAKIKAQKFRQELLAYGGRNPKPNR